MRKAKNTANGNMLPRFFCLCVNNPTRATFTAGLAGFVGRGVWDAIQIVFFFSRAQGLQISISEFRGKPIDFYLS